MTDLEKKRQQHALVVKSNELIRNSRYSLSVTEQRIILYLISKIKPDDNDILEYEFNIRDFCEVCGIDYLGNLTQLKETIKALRDKSTWIKLSDGSETLVSWIEKPYLYHNSGTIKVRLDRDMVPFLVQLKGNFTAFELIAVLALKSKFSFRLYELFKSYEYIGTYRVSIDELRKALMIQNEYEKVYDFRRYVIDKSIAEITRFTDLDVTYEVVKNGKTITGFIFTIEKDPFFDGKYLMAHKYLEGKIPSRSQMDRDYREFRDQIVHGQIAMDGYLMEDQKDGEK